MTTATTHASAQRGPELAGQTVVVIGGSSGIGLETARRALAEGAEVITRVVGPADVAALAVHIMSNTAVTGATYDIDGGQRFVWLSSCSFGTGYAHGRAVTFVHARVSVR